MLGGGSSGSRGGGRPTPLGVIRAAKCHSSRLALNQPVARELLEPLVLGGASARVQRQAQAVVAECGAENVSASTLLLAGLGASGRYPANVERELHRLVRRQCPLKVDVTTMRLTIVDTRSARAFYRKKKKRVSRTAPPPVVKEVDWPVLGPRVCNVERVVFPNTNHGFYQFLGRAQAACFQTGTQI